MGHIFRLNLLASNISSVIPYDKLSYIDSYDMGLHEELYSS